MSSASSVQFGKVRLTSFSTRIASQLDPSETISLASDLLRKRLVIQFWSMRNKGMSFGTCWESSLMLIRPLMCENVQPGAGATIFNLWNELAVMLRMTFLLFVTRIILNLGSGLSYLSVHLFIYHGKNSTM